MISRRHEGGYTLIELLIGTVILVIFAIGTYELLNALDRGLALLQGQLEAQQNPRAGMSRLIADLQESSFVTITPSYSGQATYTPTLQIQVIGALCQSAVSGASSALVDNANGLAPGLPVTIYSGTQTLSSTSENILLTNAAISQAGSCVYNGQIGNVNVSGNWTAYGNQVAYTLNFQTNLKNGYPWGALVVPATVAGYTNYYITSSIPAPTTNYGVGRFVSQSGGTENASITGFSAPGFGSVLSSNTSAGSTVVSVSEQNNACPFTIGNFVYISPQSSPVGPLQVTGVSTAAPSSATCTLAISPAATTAETAGTPVETMPNASVLQQPASAGASSITVTNPILNFCPFNAGDVVVIDPGPYQEVRSLSTSCVPATAGLTTSYTIQPTQDVNAAAPGLGAQLSSGYGYLSFNHAAGAIVLRKGTSVGMQSGYQQSESAGGYGATPASDTYFSEGFGRN